MIIAIRAVNRLNFMETDFEAYKCGLKMVPSADKLAPGAGKRWS